MREKIYRIAAVLFYLLLISYLTGSPHLILDVRGMLAVLLGLALFSLPQLGGYLKRIKGEAGSFWNKLAYNGMMSGYLTTVLFLVTHLMNTEGVESIPKLLGEDLRPVLYGLCIYTVFHAKETPAADICALPEEKKGPDNDTLYLHYQKSGLTNRETELAILAYRGYSNKEIAEMCYISEATVKKHMTHIFEKLGIEGREDLKNRGVDIEPKTAGTKQADR
ncbi:helix-turn-helix transcriptional regulator [Lachnospiraceae bacterium 47-T17]